MQKETPHLLSKIQAMGVKSMVLTRRNRHFAEVTRTDLERFGMHFGVNTVNGSGIPIIPFPYISGNERKALFLDGLFFTAGLPKGLALCALFHRAKWRPAAIVFVDDGAHHSASVEETFGNSGSDVELVTFRYSRTEEKLGKEARAGQKANHPTLKKLTGELRRVIKKKPLGCHSLLYELLQELSTTS